MRRILLTGMSGTGKSTLIGELSARGYKAIDADSHEWSEWIPYTPHPDVPESLAPVLEWVWRADRVRGLLATEADDPLFVSGCASNMTRFYAQFDHIVLLTAPADLIVRRLAARTDNPYGKHPDELARVLAHLEAVEPLLRKRATHEIDTRLPIDEVVAEVLHLIDAPR